jgi:hypothetical protein
VCKLIIVTLTLLLLCGFAGAQNTFCSANGSCTVTGAWTFTGPNAPGAVYTIDASQQTGADMCAKIASSWATAVARGWTGATVNALNFHGTQACAGSMFAGFPYTPGNSATFTAFLELDPSVVILTDVSQVIPGNVTIDGNTSHGPFGANVNTGAVIRASNAFPTATPVIQYGASTWSGVVGGTPPQGIQLRNLGIICLPPNGTYKTGSVGILNQFAQENSGGYNLHIDGCKYGIERENGGTISGSLDDGPWQLLHIGMQGVTETGARCIAVGASGTAANRSAGFRDVSCNINGAAVQPTAGISVDGLGTPLDKIHVEGFVVGVELGAITYSQLNSVRDLTCVGFVANPMTTCIDIASTNANGNTKSNIIEAVNAQGPVTNLLADNMGGGATLLTATATALGFYVHEPGGKILTSASSITSTIPTSTALNSIVSPSASGSVTMGGFTWTMNAGTSQGTAPLLSIAGQSANAGSTPLLQISTSGTNEKAFSFSMTGKNTFAPSAATGNYNLTPNNAATSGGQINSYCFLSQGNWWDGAASQSFSICPKITLTPSSGTATTATVKDTLSNSGTALTNLRDFTEYTKVLAKNLSTNTASNTDLAGTIAVSASTTGTYTFAQTYSSSPICQLTPTSDPTAVGVYWATTTTTVLTANVKTSGTITFNYHCIGRN